MVVDPIPQPTSPPTAAPPEKPLSGSASPKLKRHLNGGKTELSDDGVYLIGDATSRPSLSDSTIDPPVSVLEKQESVADDKEEEELKRMLMPDVSNLPLSPPSAVRSNFSLFFAPDFMKPGHDHYIYRHPNGLCVIGLASGHVAFKEGGVTSVDFNVGKSDRSEIKVTGKRKRNAQYFEPNTALCKVSTKDNTYIVRCCVKGSLLEVNDRLIKKPELLNTDADREGYIAILMPRPNDWLKAKASLIGLDEYNKLRKEAI